MTNRGGWSLTQGVLAACAAIGLAACSVYDSAMLPQNGMTKPPNGKDAGEDASADASNPDGGGTGDGGDDAGGCVPQTEICNGKNDDCDDETDETEAALLYCTKQRPHATMVDCVSGTCFSEGCESGYRDLDGRPQNGCEKCAVGECDDAGVDEDAGTL